MRALAQGVARALAQAMMAVACGAMLLACAPAADAQFQQGPCELAGTVVRAGDSAPLRGATVMLAPMGRRADPVVVRTDANGRFAFGNVAPGSYRLVVERIGFARQEFGQRAIGRRGVALTLAPGQRLTDLLFRMIPAGVVTGQVLDEAGEPVVGATVSVLRRVYREGEPVFQQRQADRSDDRGQYRIFNLPPGKYIVGAVARRGTRRRGPAESGDESYVPTYYPGVVDPNDAVPLEVEPGQEVSSIDFTLLPQRTVSVRGRVVASGATKGNTQVMLLPASGRAFARGRTREERVQPDGSFVIEGVAPGAYVLAAMQHDENVTAYARESLEVGSSDVEGITLALTPNGSLSGRIIAEGGMLPEARIIVSLRAVDRLARGGSGRAQPDGTFHVRNVAAGEYQLVVNGAPADYYLKSVRRGNEEFLDRELPVLRDVTGLELVLSPRGGRVEGQVLSPENLPASGVTVVLVPERQFRDQPSRYRTATTDAAGRFTVRGIRPGDYTVFSWDNDEGEVWMDPNFLATFEGQGQKVSLSEGGAQTVQVTLLAGS
ncbi:MAG: MSCRAMM family protein [Candidatus Acidiferrales bacterium]